MDKLRIGWEEWLALPELGIGAIRAKIDTGAKTSALHAFLIEPFEENGRAWVRFSVHPLAERSDVTVHCTAPLIDRREVVSSNGQAETRFVISTMAELGSQRWPIEISLTNRGTMSYRMLLGRSALQGKAIIDPDLSCILGRPPRA